MLKIFRKIYPPAQWRIPVVIISGIFAGLFLFSLYISRFFSYMGDNPSACVNCHIMEPQYATWFHSSHREKTNCNDCHVPHGNVFRKYLFKTSDGLRHAAVFTMRKEPQVIFIKEAGSKVVQENCIRCHSRLITDVKLAVYNTETNHGRAERKCIDCHRETPHGTVNSLASVPYARVPLPEYPFPGWMKQVRKNK